MQGALLKGEGDKRTLGKLGGNIGMKTIIESIEIMMHRGKGQVKH